MMKNDWMRDTLGVLQMADVLDALLICIVLLYTGQGSLKTF